MVKKAVDEYGKDNLVAILGSPDADSAELYAETLVHGDPSWLGPLAGIALDLPVYHVMEPEIMDQIDPALRKEHLDLFAIALDVEKITEGLNRVRRKD
jgi:glycine reductase